MGGKNINKHLISLLFFCILVLLMAGGVYAEDIGNSDVFENPISTDIQQDDLDISNLNVKVNYQYADDNGKINPTIKVNDKHIISKEFNSSYQNYNVILILQILQINLIFLFLHGIFDSI